MSLALLIIRLAFGLLMLAHGVQKVFGWFDGPGLTKTKDQFGDHLGLQPSWLWVALMAVGELGGGISLVLGFLMPLGAAAVFGAMFMAMFKVHFKNGFWMSKGGYEFTLLLVAVIIGIGLVGPGSFSLDALFGIPLFEPSLFLGLALAALLVDLIGMLMSRPRTVVSSTAERA